MARIGGGDPEGTAVVEVPLVMMTMLVAQMSEGAGEIEKTERTEKTQGKRRDSLEVLVAQWGLCLGPRKQEPVRSQLPWT